MARILTETAGSAIWVLAGNTTLWALIPSCIWGHWGTPTCSAAKTNFIGIPLIWVGKIAFRNFYMGTSQSQFFSLSYLYNKACFKTLSCDNLKPPKRIFEACLLKTGAQLTPTFDPMWAACQSYQWMERKKPLKIIFIMIFAVLPSRHYPKKQLSNFYRLWHRSW